MHIIHKIITFIKYDIWFVRKHALSPARRSLVSLLRITILSFRGFNQDKCSLRASALTFYTLLSIVPVIAMLFGIARGFGIEKILESQIRESLHGHEEVAEKILGFSTTLLQNTRSGVIVGIGIIALFWAVIKLLGNIELSFNEIWGVKQCRSIGRKVTDYLSMLLICPIFLVASSSITVFLTTKIQDVAQKVPLLGSPIIAVTLNLAPYITLWLLFSILYIFLTNTKIGIISGLSGGIIAGTIFHLVQWSYVTFQIFTSKYNAIYGSFAALPLFLIWLQTSWLIVLFGAEISFAHQNVDTYEYEPESLDVAYATKKLLALIIMKLCINRFCKGEPPLASGDIANEIDAPIRLIRQILFELASINLLARIKGDSDKETGYQPAISPETLTIQYVLSRYEHYSSQSSRLSTAVISHPFGEYLQKFNEKLANSPENILIKNL
ncbi:YihY/virulence factor BrkB family protein [bacterium]|nr:YihY/virulence factor BrkB family protein [bacterium]MCP5461736.1 YihY/virulence factor BrkB family protein [bacterium]